MSEPAVVIEIEERNSAADNLEYVVLVIDSSIYDGTRESGLSSNVREVAIEGQAGGLSAQSGLHGPRGHTLSEGGAAGQNAEACTAG